MIFGLPMRKDNEYELAIATCGEIALELGPTLLDRA
jgi:hypothetical protein